MNNHDATEIAYKNGYEAGYKAAIKTIPSMDATEIKHGVWVIHEKKAICSSCGWDIPTTITDLTNTVCMGKEPFKRCPECGAIMIDNKGEENEN